MKRNMRLLLIASLFAFAHEVSAQFAMVDSTTILTDRLYELAWENYPSNRMKEHNASKAYYNFKHAQWSWTDDLIAQFNLNEANIDPSSTGASNPFFPKYIFGLRISLGSFVLTPLEAKRAKEEYNVALSDVDLQRILIRNEVVKRIQAYKLSKNMLRVKTQVLDESQTLLKVIKQKFQNNEIPFDEYNKASMSNLQVMEAKYTAEAEYVVAKSELETLVGAKLETLKLPANF